ncbi:MAG: HesB/IscA family protein [Fluviibacter sp.]
MITITDSAKEKITEICKDNNAYSVTLQLKGGGCAGFQYSWGLADEAADITEDEEVFDAGEGKLAIDIMSLAYMAGSEVDYVSDLMGSQFVINNPNAKSGCGCGSSVSF